MLALLKLVRSIVATLHSEGSPTQVGLGIALGAALGLTPLVNAHNLVVVALLMLLNVSFGGGMLGWALFTPVGFLLDPLFDRVGRSLLLAPPLRETWTALFNTPLVPYTNFNNSIVLGSVAVWLVLFVPIFLLARAGVTRYRATWGPRVERTRWYRALRASRLYDVYALFRPR